MTKVCLAHLQSIHSAYTKFENDFSTTIGGFRTTSSHIKAQSCYTVKLQTSKGLILQRMTTWRCNNVLHIFNVPAVIYKIWKWFFKNCGRSSHHKLPYYLQDRLINQPTTRVIPVYPRKSSFCEGYYQRSSCRFRHVKLGRNLVVFSLRNKLRPVKTAWSQKVLKLEESSNA